MHGAGQRIGKYRDHAFAAQCHNGKSLIIFAGIDSQFVTAQSSGTRCGRNIAVGLFYRHNIGVFGKLFVGGRLDIAPGAAGNIVQDAGHLHTVCHVVKALDQTLLRGLVVVGGHQKQSIGAQCFCFLREFHTEFGVIAAGSCNDGYPALHLVNDKADGFRVLFRGHCGSFAGGAAGDDRIDPAFNLEFDELFQFFPRDLSVFVEGSHQGSCGAGKNHLLHKLPPKAQSK